ncbi:PBSX family phage terminase large subunit [Pectinatus haikarae]|uniref:PBSX family phage terminase large subunit n=1 Tax=Pectinatus haikarae TaxID=349096 RepID=A0ABT9Y3T6_9FIRM|nr:PBSX family phage terminase large subunit [Pectinatus haikarae]MDQ0202490.1 PBSX family phage terminase large subunit [Pectinatus haikarae]
MEFKEWGQKILDFIFNPIEKDAFINILEGSVRSGKTVGMIPKWIDYIMSGPPGLLIMTGVSKDTIYDNVLDDLFDTLGEDSYTYNKQSGDLIVTWYDDDSNRHKRRIKVIGAKDEGSEKYLRGKTLAGAYCDEISLMPEKFFKQLLNRLSVRGAKLYGTTNPDSPFHYLYTEYITDEAKLKSGMVKVYHFELDDNPNLPEDYKENIRAAYKGMWYKRMILGLWVIAEGIIYDMFSDDLLFDDADNLFTLTKKSECRRYIACDYGTTNPMVFLDIYDDGETIFVVNEYYYDSKKEQEQKSDEQYADDFKAFVGEEYPDFVVIDPSAASFKVVLRGRGFRIKDADNSVNDGIRNVAMLMSLRKLRVHKRCANFIREGHSYAWDEKAAQHGEEKPIKIYDHAMDAIRYFVKTILPKWRFQQ